jgi:CTP synthase (UTP-ammonia lyase)
MKEAGHTEMDPDAALPLLIQASCPVDNRPDGAPRLWGKLKIRLKPGSLAHSIYQKIETEEPFNCNYELNPVYREKLEASGLKVAGETPEGGTRIIELPGRPFFMGTGFLPQLSSEPDKPHPLIVAWLEAAVKYREQ